MKHETGSPREARRSMRRRRCRPFTILDGMILVGASAVGLALARTILGDAMWGPTNPIWVSRPITYFLLAWTLALIPLRLRRPRLPLSRLMCQPGMAACCAVAVITAIDSIAWAIEEAQIPLQPIGSMLIRYWRGNSNHLGPAVAVTWLGLALSHRCRPEPGWIDRLGQVIGGLWLLTLLCDLRFGRWTIITYRFWRGAP